MVMYVISIYADYQKSSRKYTIQVDLTNSYKLILESHFILYVF